MDEAELRRTVEAMTGRVVRALSGPCPSLDDLVAVVDVQAVLASGEPGSRTVMAELLTTFSYGAGLIADPNAVDRPAGISPAASLYGTDMLHDAVRGSRARLRHGWPEVVVNATTSLPASEAPLLYFMMAMGYTRAVERCGGVEWVERVADPVRRLLETSGQPWQGRDRVELQQTAQLVIAAAGRDPEQAEHIFDRLCRRPDADEFITGFLDLMITAAATVLGSGLDVEVGDQRLKRDIGFPDSVLMSLATVNVISSRISQRCRGQQWSPALTPHVVFGSTYEAALAALYAARLTAIHLPPAQVSTTR